MIAPMLNPTASEQLVDAQGRPTFLWDCELTLSELRNRLASRDTDERAYWVGKTMRQARPDDALVLIDPEDMARLWPQLERFLGATRAFWSWLLFERWGLSCPAA